MHQQNTEFGPRATIGHWLENADKFAENHTVVSKVFHNISRRLVDLLAEFTVCYIT